MTIKQKHLIFLLGWPLIAAALSFIFKVNALSSILLFLIIPSAYLSIILPKLIKKSGVFSIVTGLPLILIVDYILNVTHQWSEPDTIFKFRVLGVVSIETIVWAFFSIYFVVMLYEYFLDSHRESNYWHHRMNTLTVIMLALLAVFLLIYFIWPISLTLIPFGYLLVGVIIVLIPLMIEMWRRPKLLPKFLTAGAYFFYLSFLYEIPALKLGWWTFPSTQYAGMVSLLGVSFPLEELVFYLMVLAMGILAYYEPFDDDEK